MGTINLGGIKNALEFDNVPLSQTNIQKILIYANNYLIQQQEDKDNG